MATSWWRHETASRLALSRREVRRRSPRCERDGGAVVGTRGFKEQLSRIGVTVSIRLVDKVSWLNVATQDGPFDMYVEDLASLFTLDQNTLLSHSTAAWNTTRHTDTRVDDYYARYAREMDPARRKAIAKEFQEFMADKLYWNTISGSPFYEVAQPWMKDYVYNSEWKVLYKKVWLDK
jgi:ABC-type transport system substrate-binding protein